MTQADQAQLGEMRSTILSMAERLQHSNELPHEAIADLKGAVDDLRIRLWGVLMAGDATQYQDFVGRFRMRRAAECCRGIDHDVAAGVLKCDTLEGTQLQHAARHLANQLDAQHPLRG